jgi:hypothetical protein
VALFREGVLQQSALDPVDSYCSPQKQFALLDQMLAIYQQGLKLLEFGVPVQELLRLPLLAEAQRLKGNYTNDQMDELHRFALRANGEFERLRNQPAVIRRQAVGKRLERRGAVLGMQLDHGNHPAILAIAHELVDTMETAPRAPAPRDRRPPVAPDRVRAAFSR